MERKYNLKKPTEQTEIEEETKQVKELRDEKEETLLEKIEKEILSEPILKLLDYNRRFSLKTDWPRMAMGAVLL